MKLCFLQLFVSCLILGFNVTKCRKAKQRREWDGVLRFKDDFEGFEVKKNYWRLEEGCTGKWKKDTNLECFVASDDNIRVKNGTLILRAIPQISIEKKLYGLVKNYTSARLRTNSWGGFSHGTFVIKARFPRGKFLLPSISLVPTHHQDQNICKYEEIQIVQARGHKPSNLMFFASYGKRWGSVATQGTEKAFPGVDFSKESHEFAFVWKPKRMEWYVDGNLVYTVSTYFYSDWILSDESNVPCSKDKSLFKQPLELSISLAVGGPMFNDLVEAQPPLTPKEARKWPKPTFEIESVEIYQF